MGIPIPRRMTREQIDAAERFSLAVFGAPMFDASPSHNGRHGYGCEHCLPLLRERDVELERVNAIRQPWDLREAA